MRKHGNAIIIWTGIGYCARQAALALIAYAGKTSLASLTMNVAANVSVVWTISISASGLAITLYLRERNLHRRTRDRLTDRITELEVKIDPTRTSSNLTPEGTTRKEDK